MRTVFSYLLSYKWAAIIAFIFMLLELTVELIQPLLLARIIDDGILQEDLTTVIVWGSVMIGLSLVAFVAGILNSFYAGHAGQSTGFDLRNAMFKNIQRSSLDKLQPFATSSLMTRLTNDITQIQNTIFMGLRIMARAPLLVVGGAFMAFLINARLAFFLILTIPILIFFLLWILKKGVHIFGQVQNQVDKVNHVVRENLTGIRLVRVFVRKAHEVNRFFVESDTLRKRMVQAFRLMELTMPVLLLLMNASILLVLWFGSFQIDNNTAQVGDVVAIVNYATRITSALGVFAMIIMVFSRAKASALRIEEVLLEPDDELKGQVQLPQPPTFKGEVQFQSVWFSYDGQKEPVLEDISFHVHAGETVAVLGETGSGKTSLFQLIPKLYEADSGEVTIDGTSIKHWNIQELRKQLGYVPQSIRLFSGTIRENIAWGVPDASLEQIVLAAKAAQIHETIEKLEQGYDTVVGQQGVNLSGGQKQRISIARALLREPKILLLDDSTSALDTKTEEQFLHALEDYSCTTLIITQKLSTARKADKILLLEFGKIEGYGSHEQLMEQSSFYRKIHQSQYGKEE
ncbi:MULTISPECIES: ABC transporter ATP-binding protein [Shouchella]|uniref:ABC transporter ATP-binding protein n=2 Tax=Shouchella TaxID=2893057 RepID=A0ABY7W266_9BACI|nr:MULTISPECIES: ABC transporter ATP-binding protein [Shouchella]MED4130273.1 ABC transporter ATP-binding protein [Shouchella miscanthi]WDF02661.1 ABC transporter ATP-binding protein [Shouchella hunanensis]